MFKNVGQVSRDFEAVHKENDVSEFKLHHQGKNIES